MGVLAPMDLSDGGIAPMDLTDGGIAPMDLLIVYALT